MKRVIAALVLVACGPSVGVTTEGGDDGAGSSTGSDGSRGDVGDDGNSDGSASSITVGTTVADGSSSSSSDDGSTFIDVPPCFTHCTPEECDSFTQDCPEGEKCVPWAQSDDMTWDARRCAPVDPTPALVGEPCIAENFAASGLDDCEIGAMCWGVDPVTLAGECAALCSGTPDAPICPEGRTCVSMFDDRLTVCVPPCDPLAPACADDEACTLTNDDLQFACLPTPPFVRGEYGAPCDAGLSSCGGGFVCVNPELVPGCTDFGCCTVLADIDDPPVCPDASQTCIPFEEVDPTMCICGVPR